jgi:hypothetical protein
MVQNTIGGVQHMFHRVAQMSLEDAEEAFRRAVRNLSIADVDEIEANPGKLDDESHLVRYARRLRRRIHELRDGIVFAEGQENMHHSV